MGTTVAAAAGAAAVAAAEQTGRIDRVQVDWIEAPGKDSFEVEMTCSRRDSRCVEEQAAEAVVGRDSAAAGGSAGAAVGIEVAVIGRRRSPVEADRMHQAIVPVVFALEVVRAMDFEEQLITVCQMDLKEQMFETVFSSRRG